MILDVEPIANILALAVDRQRLSIERLDDHERNEFFRKMIGAVIVRAIGEQGRQPIGLVPGANQMVGGRLAAE